MYPQGRDARPKGFSNNSVPYASLLSSTEKVGTHASQIGTAIFCFAISVHTFSQLFLRRQWSNRTSHTVLLVSWAVVLLEVCIEVFVIAKAKDIGRYYGIAGLWCWITPAYPISRFATSYLLMFVSAGLSFILYLLVFFQLRGNITVSAGYKIEFHRRPRVRVGRTGNGAYIVTDDQRVESHLTRVAKHMLWYPVVFLVIILPMASARLSSFNGASVPFPVTICAAGLFMLHGFINTVLFCTTRNILSGGWRRRLGLGSAMDSGRSDLNLPSRTNAIWRFAGLDGRIQTIGTGPDPVVLSVGVEKDVEIMYDEAQPRPRCIKLGASFTPNALPITQAGGEQQADTPKHPSFPHHKMQG